MSIEMQRSGIAKEASANAQPDNAPSDAQPIINRSREQEELPPGTIQACCRSGPPHPEREALQ
jgi:hypothetical protein